MNRTQRLLTLGLPGPRARGLLGRPRQDRQRRRHALDHRLRRPADQRQRQRLGRSRADRQPTVTRASSMNPSGPTSDLMNVEIQSYEVTYTRDDTGTRVPPQAGGLHLRHRPGQRHLRPSPTVLHARRAVQHAAPQDLQISAGIDPKPSSRQVRLRVTIRASSVARWRGERWRPRPLRSRSKLRPEIAGESMTSMRKPLLATACPSGLGPRTPGCSTDSPSSPTAPPVESGSAAGGDSELFSITSRDARRSRRGARASLTLGQSVRARRQRSARLDLTTGRSPRRSAAFGSVGGPQSSRSSW